MTTRAAFMNVHLLSRPGSVKFMGFQKGIIHGSKRIRDDILVMSPGHMASSKVAGHSVGCTTDRAK